MHIVVVPGGGTQVDLGYGVLRLGYKALRQEIVSGIKVDQKKYFF